MSQLPALLGQNQPIAPITIDMFGVEGEGERQQNIFQYAMTIVHHLQVVNASAIQMCIYLHLCREEFRCTGEDGWGNFCKKNFEFYGLSSSNIRNAIRTGKALLMISDKYENGELPDLRSVSRAALFVFGDAPVEIQDQLLVEMTAISEEKGKSPTAAEVRQLSKNLQEAEGKIRDLGDEIRDAEETIRTKDGALHRLINMTRARESEADSMREEIDRLKLKAKTPVESLVHKMPPGVESAEQMRQLILEEVSIKKNELAEVEASIVSLLNLQTKLESNTAAKQKAYNALESLDSDILLLQRKYSDALVQNIRKADPQNDDALRKVANRLRVMADHLCPPLV